MLGLTFVISGCGAKESSGSDCETACGNAKRICIGYDDAKCKANCAAANTEVRNCVAAASDCDAAENCFSVGGSGGT